MTEQNDQKSGNGRSFDMYRFFSRWDVLLITVIVLLLILYAIASHFSAAPHGAV